MEMIATLLAIFLVIVCVLSVHVYGNIRKLCQVRRLCLMLQELDSMAAAGMQSEELLAAVREIVIEIHESGLATELQDILELLYFYEKILQAGNRHVITHVWGRADSVLAENASMTV